MHERRNTKYYNSNSDTDITLSITISRRSLVEKVLLAAGALAVGTVVGVVELERHQQKQQHEPQHQKRVTDA